MPNASRHLDTHALFDPALPSLVARRAGCRARPKVVATFRVVGGGGGTWTLRCERARGDASRGGGDGQIKIIVGDRTLRDILAGTLDAHAALESRAMSILGDRSCMPDLSFLFSEPMAGSPRAGLC